MPAACFALDKLRCTRNATRKITSWARRPMHDLNGFSPEPFSSIGVVSYNISDAPCVFYATRKMKTTPIILHYCKLQSQKMSKVQSKLFVLLRQPQVVKNHVTPITELQEFLFFIF